MPFQDHKLATDAPTHTCIPADAQNTQTHTHTYIPVVQCCTSVFQATMKLGLVALFLAGITQGSSSRVSYEYHTLEEDAGPSITNRNIVFSWEFNGFSHCSVSCGTGQWLC